MKITKNMMSLSLLCLVGFGSASCSNTEIGLGVGTAVGGIIGYKVGQNHNNQPSRCNGSYNCNGYRRNNNGRRYSLEMDLPAAVVDTQNDAAVVADKYNISYPAAELIVTSLHQAENKDYSGLKNLGLKASDVLAVYNNQSMKAESLQALGQNLNMDNSHTAALVEHMTADIQAEKAQLGSQE
jgi:hypothetical protein